MKINRWLAILAALALGIWSYGVAGAQDIGGGQDEELTQEIEVTVNNADPPTVCKLCANGCSPSNMRSTGGTAYLTPKTDSNASGQVTVYYGYYTWGNMSPRTTRSFGGGQSSLSIGGLGSPGYYRFAGGCSNAAGSIPSDSWTTILSCFLAGTPILMSDGSYKNIEDVKVGEQVLSYDPATQQFVPAGVVNTVTAETNKYFVVNGELKITPAHPLYVNGSWQNSENMKVGDILIGEDGKPVTITSLETIEATVPVYNLITTDPHDFFAAHILVHNLNPGAEHKGHGLFKGTMIARADGKLVPIEQIKPGDKLIAYDNIKKRYAISTVQGTGKQKVSKTIRINGKLRVGMKQPMLTAESSLKDGKK